MGFGEMILIGVMDPAPSLYSTENRAKPMQSQNTVP